MKTTKKLTAIILSIAVLFSLFITSASAIHPDESIEWFFNDGNDTYYPPCIGTLNEGVNEIEAEFDYYVAYEFTAPESGYYEFYSLGCFTNVAEKYENHIAYDYTPAYNCWTNDDRLVELYYISKGTTAVEVLAYDSDASIKIAYAGNITDIAAEDDVLDFLILGENAHLEDNESVWVYPFNHYLKMDTGKDYAPNNSGWTFNLTDGGFVKGENTLIYTFNDFEKEYTANISEITDFISNIEIENIEPYLESYDYYDGVYDCCCLGETPEEITVTFTDGTVKTIVYCYAEDSYNTSVELPNGVECYISAYQTGEADDRKFILEIANHTYIEEECNVTKQGLSENMKHFKENIGGILLDYKYHLEWCFNGLMGNGYNEPFHYIPEIFNTIYLKSIFINIELLFKFFL